MRPVRIVALSSIALLINGTELEFGFNYRCFLTNEYKVLYLYIAISIYHHTSRVAKIVRNTLAIFILMIKQEFVKTPRHKHYRSGSKESLVACRLRALFIVGGTGAHQVDTGYIPSGRWAPHARKFRPKLERIDGGGWVWRFPSISRHRPIPYSAQRKPGYQLSQSLQKRSFPLFVVTTILGTTAFGKKHRHRG